MKRILLITHDASRTGAPLVVLHFARWLRRNCPALEVDVLAVKGGALADEFRAIAGHYLEQSIPAPAPRSMLRRVWNKAMRVAGIRREPTAAELKDGLLQQMAGRGHDVILANSLMSIPAGVRVKAMASRKPVLIAHIHELEMVIRQMLPDLPRHLADVDHVWAGSGLVAEGLHGIWGVPRERIQVQYPCAAIAASTSSRSSSPEVQLHVVGLGSVVLRKGYDLFIQVAAWVRRHHPELPVQFTWGGPVGAYERPLIEHDLKLAGLVGHVEFIGEQQDPTALYTSTDVFLLPSREDPFPLVCIEVGAMGKPIVCFEGATGTAEVLRHGGGMIVPYLDVEAMGRAVVDYARDPERRRKDGELNRVQFANFGPDQQCPLMWQRITAAWEEQDSKR